MHAAGASLLAVALALAASAAGAQAVSPAPDTVAVTVYRSGISATDAPGESPDPEGGLAMVTETRTVDVPAGRSTIVFRGVADTIVPQTAAIEGLSGRLVERNQDYDLLSAGALIRKWLGKPVELVRTNRETGEETRQPAILRSGPNGVALEVDGHLEAFKCGGPPERLVFEAPGAGLVDKPTLSLVTDSPEAGRRTVTLSYLATGLRWSADYVAQIAADGRTLDLIGWVTLANGSGTTFREARTQAVAGNLNVEDDTEPVLLDVDRVRSRCWPMDTTTKVKTWRPPQERYESIQDVPIAISSFSAGDVDMLIVTAQKRAEESQLADYKLYTLPEPTTVAARQTKQVLMLTQERVRFERFYLFVMHDDTLSEVEDEEVGEDLAPATMLRLRNTASEGLGKALPGGAVSVMAPDGHGALALVGEQFIRDVPVGQPFDIALGAAMNVSVHPRLADETDVAVRGEKRTRRTFEVAFASDKAEPVTLEYVHNIADYDESVRVVSSSMRRGLKYGQPTWTVRLKPGETRTLRYTLEFADP